MQTNVANLLGLDNTTTGDQPMITTALNKAVNKVLEDTHCYVTSTTITPGATADYTLAASILEIIDLYFSSGGSDYCLERVSVPQLLRMRQNASGAAGPTRYYALAGHNTVMWYPTPAAADTITVYYVPVPTELSAGSDDPSSTTYGGIPKQLHDALEWWAAGWLADYDDDQSSAQGQRYRDLYQEEIRRGRRWLRRKGGVRLPRVRVGNPRLIPHDNSFYSSGY